MKLREIFSATITSAYGQNATSATMRVYYDRETGLYRVVVEIPQIDDTKKRLEVYQSTDSIDSDRLSPASNVNSNPHCLEIFQLH